MTLRRSFALLVACGLLVAGWAYWTAIADPVVREAELAPPRWPMGAPRVRAVLISDLHASPPDMTPRRIGRIVAQINALRPDVVLIAGDFLSEKWITLYSADEAVAPLAGLRARFGVYAVLGNHDHWIDGRGVRRALARARVRLLTNEAAQAGPLVIGGLDDAFTGHDNLGRTLAAMRALPGARILLSHSPDPFPALPADVTLMLAGHTHCGQIRLPLIGAPRTMSAYGQLYACGLVRENGRTLIVTAGLGTSGLPLRLGAVPDLWLIHLGPL
jgi:uncharacterized protein